MSGVRFTMMLTAILISTHMYSQSCAKLWKKAHDESKAEDSFLALEKYIDKGCSSERAKALLERGLITVKAGDTVAAQIDFNKSLEIDSNMAEAWYQLAAIEYQPATCELQALIYLDKAINIAPNNWRYTALAADQYVGCDDFENALYFYRKSISNARYDTRMPKLYTSVAGVLGDIVNQHEIKNRVDTLRLTQEVAYLDTSLALDSNYAISYDLLGNAQYHLGEYEQSIRAFKKYLTFYPESERGKTNLAYANREAGKYYGQVMKDFDKSIYYLKESIKLKDDDYSAYQYLGIVYGLKGESSLSLECFLRSQELFPENQGIWTNLSITYDLLGEKKKAEECRKMKLKLESKAQD